MTPAPRQLVGTTAVASSSIFPGLSSKSATNSVLITGMSMLALKLCDDADEWRRGRADAEGKAPARVPQVREVTRGVRGFVVMGRH